MDQTISSISSTLCSFMDIDEKQLKNGTIKFLPPKEKVGKGNRFAILPNFRLPANCPERPESALGRVAFYMGHSFVVKHVNYEDSGDKVQYHAVVVAADGRTLSANAAKFDGYISRDDAVLVVRSADGKAMPALFTNIHPDKQGRNDFWNGVTRIERRPSRDLVTLYPQRLSNEEWTEILEDYDSPPELMCGLLCVQAYPFDNPPPVVTDKCGGVAVQMPRAKFRKLKRYLKRVGKWNHERPCTEIKCGQGGRIQRRVVAELPTGLSPEGMYRVGQRFAEYLASWGVMYTVVVHAPELHSDQRNFHIHAVIYDRPCTFLDEHGCWDFEYAVPVKRYRGRVRYPLRQKKISSLSRPSSGKYSRKYIAQVMMEFRENYANICNEELAKCGCKRLFDHRSYEAMGIRQTPMERMSQRDTLLCAAGIPTTVDVMNAERSWQGGFDRTHDNIQLEQKSRRVLRARVEKAIAAARDSGLDSEALREASRHLVRFDALMSEIEPREWPVTKLYLILLMATSRADKAAETCERLIESIDAGVAKASDRRWEDEIRDRYKDAMDHSDHVHLAAFKSIQAIDVQAKVDQLADLGSDLRTLVETVELETEAARDAAINPEPSGIDLNLVELTPLPDEPAQIGHRPACSSDHEEAWERILRKIEEEELEVEPERDVMGGYCVPALSYEEQELLRNPQLIDRAQHRLRVIYRYRRLLSAQEETSFAQAVDADPAPARDTDFGCDASQMDAAHVDSAAVSAASYDEPLECQRAKREMKRQQDAHRWLNVFEKHYLGKPLPISFDRGEPVVDVRRLPSHLAIFAAAFPDYINPLIVTVVNAKRELVRQAILSARAPLIHMRAGWAEYDLMEFCPEIRIERDWLLDRDPVVHRYAVEAMERARDQSMTALLPGKEPRPTGLVVNREAGSGLPDAGIDNSAELKTQAEWLRRLQSTRAR